MEQVEFDGIIFTDTLQAYNSLQYAGRVTHILCQEGNMGFTFQETRYNIAAGDYVILPNPALVSGFSESDDFQGIDESLGHVRDLDRHPQQLWHHRPLVALAEPGHATFIS